MWRGEGCGFGWLWGSEWGHHFGILHGATVVDVKRIEELAEFVLQNEKKESERAGREALTPRPTG